MKWEELYPMENRHEHRNQKTVTIVIYSSFSLNLSFVTDQEDQDRT